MIRLIAALIFLLARSDAQQIGQGVSRDFEGKCSQIDAIARTYLKSRGFTKAQCQSCPNSLVSPKSLLDGKGQSVGTLRIRRELTATRVPFWLWSSPLHATIFLFPTPQEHGCRLHLWVDFESFHTMVAVIFPGGLNLGLPSNGRLEAEYLDAIQEQTRPDVH